MKALSRRVQTLQDLRNRKDEQFIVVPIYRGSSKEEAFERKFGAVGPPPGATLIVIENALPNPFFLDELTD